MTISDSLTSRLVHTINESLLLAELLSAIAVLAGTIYRMNAGSSFFKDASGINTSVSVILKYLPFPLVVMLGEFAVF